MKNKLNDFQNDMNTSKLTILHICNDFSGSKVHSNLCRKLSELVNRQIIYTYFDGKEKIGKNSFSSCNTQIIYDDILNSVLRKIYPLKMQWVYKHLIRHINPTEINCIYATTLFSDGGIAYMLYKKYGIPYIVAVRTTDLTIYINRTKLLWGRGRKILLNASKIILINDAYKEWLKQLDFSRVVWDEIKGKIIIQPNGIDEYWINNVTRKEKPYNNQICYVGTFIKRKNIPRLIQAIDSVHEEYPLLHLTLIGGGGNIGNEEDVIMSMVNERPYVSRIGRISNKDELRGFYERNCIFVMPSYAETFGLVYIEALTQNLRILYSKNDGVDGLVNNVGVAVDPYSVEDIANGLRNVIQNYDLFDGAREIDFSVYDWGKIADNYKMIFDSITND